MLNEDSLERELSCGICFELYNEPLQLPCMHTFCKDCVKDIIANSRSRKLKCPDCRRNVDLGKTGIESLKRNFKLASIVDLYRQASEKLANKETNSAKSDGGIAEGGAPDEKDYEFLSSVIKKSHANASDPFETQVIDDLWGTFTRTGRSGSYMRDRPPVPPPSRVHNHVKQKSTRPLPPIPDPTTRNSRDLSRPMRRAPPDPSSPQVDPRESPPVRAPPPVPFSEEDRLQPSAPSYFTLGEAFSGPSLNHHAIEDDLNGEPFDAPPVPPRFSQPPTPSRSMDNRPPIPVPRGKKKNKSPPTPSRDKTPADNSAVREGTLQDGRRPPPPLPRSRLS